MASFAKARDQLLVVHDEGTIGDEEFALLLEQNVSNKNLFRCFSFKTDLW